MMKCEGWRDACCYWSGAACTEKLTVFGHVMMRRTEGGSCGGVCVCVCTRIKKHLKWVGDCVPLKATNVTVMLRDKPEDHHCPSDESSENFMAIHPGP